jgi:ADP-ribose pyrophosphatase YjhB (NUDIX family)
MTIKVVHRATFNLSILLLDKIMILTSNDNQAWKFPVSIKGIVIIDGKIPLLKNERNEFELPGGKLEIQEQPIDCVAREIQEELNLTVSPSSLIDSWLYTISQGVHVVIITYGCILTSSYSQMKISNEHKELILIGINEVDAINMPSGYKDSIKKWFTMSQVSMC